MLNTLLGHVHFGSALYSLSFPFLLHYHLFFRTYLVSYVYISTSQKSDSHLVDPRLFLWTRLLALTYFVKAEEDPPLSPMPEAEQERGFVL